MTQLIVAEDQAGPRTPFEGADPPGAPIGSASTTQSYLLCATPRTGSYLLADLLCQTGRAGRPTEYFSSGYQQHWAKRWGTTTYVDYLRRVLDVGTDRNGVFGAKAHPRQLRNFAQQETVTSAGTNVELRAALERWLPAPRYVWLRRDDKLRQAISWAKSMQTNVWWDTQVAPAPFDEPAPDGLRFDVEFLMGALVRMRREERMWERFFAENDIAAYTVWYEDLAIDPRKVLEGVVDFLGLPNLGTATPVTPSLRRQSDETSERWVRRYVALRAAHFEGTFSACDGLETGYPDMLVTDRPTYRPAAWDEAKHSLLAYGHYPGPFKPDYRLGAPGGAAEPRASLHFVENRSTATTARDIVLPAAWLARLDPGTGLDRRHVRAVALAAHLGADRVGLSRDVAGAHHADVDGCRVVALDDHDCDIDAFLTAPPRPTHERRVQSGRLIALCVRGELPEWARSLRNCIAMLTRDRCIVVEPSDVAKHAPTDAVLITTLTDAAPGTAIVVREVADAMLELTAVGRTRYVPQPIDWWSRRNRPAPRASAEIVVDTAARPGRIALAGLARGAVVVASAYGRFVGAPLVVAPAKAVDAISAELRQDPSAMAQLGHDGRDWLVRHADFNIDWDESWAPVLATAVGGP